MSYSHYRTGPKAPVLLQPQTILAAAPSSSTNRLRTIRTIKTSLPKTQRSPKVPSEISARTLENSLKIPKNPKRINQFRKIAPFLKWDLRSPRPRRRSSEHLRLASQAWDKVNGGLFWTVKAMLPKNEKAVFRRARKSSKRVLPCYSTTIRIKKF